MRLTLLFVALVATGCLQDVSNTCQQACAAYAKSCSGTPADTTQCEDRCESDISAKGGACTASAAQSCDADHYVELHCLAL